MRTEEYLRTAHAFAQAGVDGEAWHGALESLASLTRSSFGELIAFKADVPMLYISGTEEAFLRDFQAAGAYDHRVNPKLAVSLDAEPMQVFGDREYEEILPFLRSEAYLDLTYKYDMQYGCQTTLYRSNDVMVGLTALRTRRDGRMDSDSAAAFAAIAPVVLSAVKTQVALGQQSLVSIAGGLEHAGIAAFLCDANGRVQAMTGRGERLAVEARVLTVRQNQLAAIDAQDERRLRGALAGVLRTGLTDSGTEVLAMGPPGRQCAVHVRALPVVPWDLTFLPRVLVIVREGPRTPSAQLLRIAFGLTTAEAEIALALASGQSRELIAFERRVTINTLRQQIKTILAKVDVSRETELVLAVQGLG
jgi:DNA-binding CsgD family transcriptional regulator